jgi:chromosome segregation ATPase
MTRRNLSDVLRQEAKKEAPEAQADQATTPTKTSAAKTKVAKMEAVKAEAVRSTKTTPEPALESVDQSAQIAELKAALVQGAAQEKNLQAQLKQLQSEVERKQKQVDTLEQQLAQVEKVKAELADAKEMILQLSEVNTQMSATLDELKKPAAPTVRKEKTMTRTLSAPPLPAHAIQHHDASGSTPKPKTIDVGWMD